MSIYINKLPQRDPRLGRHVEHDSRSKAFAFKVTTPKKDATIFWEDDAPILNQKNLGGCVGFTGADIANTQLFTPVRKALNNGKFYGNTDGISFYKGATANDDIKGTYPPNDTGSSGLGLAKYLKKIKVIDSYTHAFTWDAYIQAILTQPVAMGTLWTNQMFNPDAGGQIHVGALTNDNIAGGHEWSIRGRDVKRGLNLGRNHWDSTWNPTTQAQKLPGEFWISDADLKLLLSPQAEGDVTVLHGAGLP